MGLITPVEERLVSEAQFGLFFAYFSISKKTAISLRDKGLEVTDSKETNSYPRIHRISWENAKVKCKDVASLNEESSDYTFAQKLWVISHKNQLPIKEK